MVRVGVGISQECQRWCMQCPTHRAASLIWTTCSNDVSHDLGKPCSRHPHTWAHKPYTLCIWLILTAPGWFPLLVFPLHYTLWCPPLLLHLPTLNSIAQSSSAHSSSSSSHYPVWKPTHETTITSLSLYKHHCSASQPPMNVQNLQEFKVWGCTWSLSTQFHHLPLHIPLPLHLAILFGSQPHETTISSLSFYKHHCSASQPPMNVQNL